ncbi:hypothetical protein [Actinokineospora iranica]|uniref:Uncharacterized protein n=1 Tax=Actinokineospora iranica TaxID=1271860 RepID=A0A1G6Q5L1_9PSEU|nr:hypothetical protein [Actinokineospora iranica]SDC87629.1 hypothetical protein SAMN05216174_105104 [Actinokineospora iranica]
MDQQHFATATEVCRRLSGRLSDDVVSVVQSQFFAGETEIALSALLLNLHYEGVAVTGDEAALIRALLPDGEDLSGIPVADMPPPLAYRFSPTAPDDAPNPAAADEVVAAEAALLGARRVRRAWREPLPEAANPPTWVYLVQVGAGVSELRAHNAITSRLWVRNQEKWPVEVVVEGTLLPPYQAAAVTAAQQIWAA